MATCCKKLDSAAHCVETLTQAEQKTKVPPDGLFQIPAGTSRRHVVESCLTRLGREVLAIFLR